MDLKILLSAIVLAFYGLFMAALVTKYREVKRARGWLPAPGRIVSSRAEARMVKRGSTGSGRGSIKDTEIRNFATVRYEFSAAGRRLSGSRIGIGEDPGNFQVAEKLHRYPVGTGVTVFYDPDRPETCVIERDMPDRMFEIALLVGSLAGACLLAGIFALNGIFTRLGPLGIAPERLPAVLFLAVMGLAMLGFGWALRKRGAATYAWPMVTGTILSSTVDLVKIRLSLDPASLWRVRSLFRSRTIYNYQVDGVVFKSDRTSFGAQTYASVRLFARIGAARFVAGQPVAVYYDPAAPEQAVTTRGAPGLALVWLGAAAMFATAAFVGGIV